MTQFITTQINLQHTLLIKTIKTMFLRAPGIKTEISHNNYHQISINNNNNQPLTMEKVIAIVMAMFHQVTQIHIVIQMLFQ